MEKTGFVVFALLATLSGCATPTAQYMWVKNGATQADFDRDMAQCNYEATAATAGYSTGATARTGSGAFVQGFGEGMTRGVRQNELVQLCLQAKGYSKQPSYVPRSEMEKGASTSSPSVAQIDNSRPTLSQKEKWVTTMATKNGCEGGISVNIKNKDGIREVFEAICGNKTLEFTCEFSGPIREGSGNMEGIPFVTITGKAYQSQPACWR